MNGILIEILENCQSSIKLHQSFERGTFLMRGTHKKIKGYVRKDYSIVKRTPLNLPLEFHNAVNKHYKEIFGWPVRNGLFCYGVKSNYNGLKNLGYGKDYLLFPVGEFQYVYDPNIFDLAAHYHKLSFPNNKVSPKDFIDTIAYLNTNLCAYISTPIYEGRSVEVIINCESYYLIDPIHIPQIEKMIWGP